PRQEDRRPRRGEGRARRPHPGDRGRRSGGTPGVIVLFDLDGTLIDSIELIRRSYDHTYRTHLGRPLDEAAWLQGLGRPLRYQLLALTTDEAEVAAMTRTYRAHNAEHHDRLVRPYPGIEPLLDALRDRG